jgi:translation initiation factor IF-3
LQALCSSTICLANTCCIKGNKIAHLNNLPVIAQQFNKPGGGGNRPFNRGKGYQKQEEPYRINERIKIPKIRLVGDNVENGIVETSKALAMAQAQGLDLVEIAPNADPPVCKIIDYSKFKYEQKKKAKEMKQKAQKVIVKDIRFSPNTDDHDFDFKLKHATNFLKEGAKVKAYVQFTGREIVFRDRGETLLKRFLQALEEFGKPEEALKMEGKRMQVMIAPKPAKTK